MNLKHTNCQNEILAAIRDIDVLSILLHTEVSQESGLTKMGTRTSPFCRSVKASYAPINVKREWGGGGGRVIFGNLIVRSVPGLGFLLYVIKV